MGGIVDAIGDAVSSGAKAVGSIISSVSKGGGWKGILSGGLKQFAFSF